MDVDVGDLMDMPFVIYPNGQAAVHWTKVNEVSVTPRRPLLADGYRGQGDA
ncbi:hypothetical protein ISS98_19705 [Dyella flagellata]|nr:hypothetical protein [Dyella flagellata]